MSNTYPVSIKFSATDRATATMKRISASVSRSFSGMTAAASKTVASLKMVGSAVTSMAKKAALVGAGVGIGTGYIVKGWLEASMQMEGYFAKLKTALKSGELAQAAMEWAKDFAANTPFSMSAVVDAVARLEMYGLAAKKWLPLVGDMAGAMGRDVTDAVEAIADAISGGGLERLKEFGISSSALKAAGWSGSYEPNGGGASAEKRAKAEEKLQSARRDWAERIADIERTSARAIRNAQESVWGARTWQEREKRQRRYSEVVGDAGRRVNRAYRDMREELNKLARAIGESGGGGGTSVAQALESIMQTRFGGGMKEMMETAVGSLSNFKDAVGKVKVALGDILKPAFKELLAFATPVLTTLARRMEEFGKTAGPAVGDWLKKKMEALAEWFTSRGPSIIEWFAGLTEKGRQWAAFLIASWPQIQAWFRGLWQGFMRLRQYGVQALQWVLGQYQKLREALADPEVRKNLSEMWGSLKEVAAALGKLAVDQLNQALTSISDNLPAITEAFKSMAADISGTLVPTLQKLDDWVNSSEFIKILDKLEAVLIFLGQANHVTVLKKLFQDPSGLGDYVNETNKNVSRAWNRHGSSVGGGDTVMGGPRSAYAGGGTNYGSAGNGTVTVRLRNGLVADQVSRGIQVQQDRTQGEMIF